MAFLGSIGKFFTTGVGKYIYPPATVNVVLGQQLSRGDVNPLHYVQALKTTYLPTAERPPRQVQLDVSPTSAALLASYGAYGYQGYGSGYAPEGGDPWRTDLTSLGATSGLWNPARYSTEEEAWGSPTYWEE